MAQVTKDMLIGQLLQLDPNMAGILMASGMGCVGCHPHRWNLWRRLLWYTELMLMF